MRSTWGRWFNNKTSPATEEEKERSITQEGTQRQNQCPQGSSGVTSSVQVGCGDCDTMDQDDSVDYVQIIPFDSYDFQRAKQRASIKWLLSKAYNHKIPEDLIEPFYKDHEGEEHLKPHIVKGLSDAELYCLALCNLYADPNFSQLSPWGIVQTLGRKGVYVQSTTSTDVQLTETLLIQNRPLRIVAHMTVLEGVMNLQVKEILSSDRMRHSVQRYGPPLHPHHKIWLGAGEMPSDHEEAFILWINTSILAIKEYIQNNNSKEHGLNSDQVESWTQLSLFQDLNDLSDGIGLCALLGYYCQDDLALNEITLPSCRRRGRHRRQSDRGDGDGGDNNIDNSGDRSDGSSGNDSLNVSESLWNLQLVQRVCRDSLPYNVCHFNYEDLLYFHDSMKQNILSFLADLFNQLELNPSQNIKLLGSHQPLPIRPSERNPTSHTLLRSQSATTTPKKQQQQQYNNNNTFTSSLSQEIRKNRKTSSNIFFSPERGNDTIISSQQSSPPQQHNIVSVPIRRSTPPQKQQQQDHHHHHHHHPTHSTPDKPHRKDQRYYGNSSDSSEEFIVHHGRNVPTLSQVIRSMSPSSQDERNSPINKMTILSRNISMNEVNNSGGGLGGVGGGSGSGSIYGDDGNIQPAGRPSNLGTNKTSYAGRRSRRNSFSEVDSQLTVENFGGSQENLNNKYIIGKNPDKQPAVLMDQTTENLPIRYLKKHGNVDIPQDNNGRRRKEDGGGSSPSSSSPHDYDHTPPPIFYGKKKMNYTLEAIEKEDGISGIVGGGKNLYEKGRHSDKTYYQSDPEQQPLIGIMNQDQFNQKDNNNLTVYMMNDDTMSRFGGSNRGGVSGGGGGGNDIPLRSASLTNLSRLSDHLQNKPINIVYLQNTGTNGSYGNGGGGPSSNGYNKNDKISSRNESPGDVSRNTLGINPASMNPRLQQQQQQQQQQPTSSHLHHSQLVQRQHLYRSPSPQSSSHSSPRSQYDTPSHEDDNINMSGSGGNESIIRRGRASGESSRRRESGGGGSGGGGGDGGDDDEDTDELAAQLATIRLKLEEKRKRIEMEKGRMESVASKNQFKLGKAAYLKAINKDDEIGRNEKKKIGNVGGGGNIMGDSLDVGILSRVKPLSLSLKDLESKWLNKTEEQCRTPQIENMDMETYQKSLAKMDTSLCELETDIGRLTAQQEQIQRQFFLHGRDSHSHEEDIAMELNDDRTDRRCGGGGGRRNIHEQINHDKRKTWTIPIGGDTINSTSSGNQTSYWSSTQQQQQLPCSTQSYWDNQPPIPSKSSSTTTQQQYNGRGDGDNRLVPSSSFNTTSNKSQSSLPSSSNQRITNKQQSNLLSGIYSNNNNNNSPNNGLIPLPSNNSSTSSFRLHSNADSQGNRLFSRHTSGESSGERDDIGRIGGDDELRPTPPPRRIHQAPLPTPPPDDMEPQSVCFVQEDNPLSSTELNSIIKNEQNNKSSLHITSGSKTYRITPESGSPPRPSAHRLFNTDNITTDNYSLPTSDENPSSLMNERGFYIPLDNTNNDSSSSIGSSPLKPKPPLRTKSPTKKSSSTSQPISTTSIHSGNNVNKTNHPIHHHHQTNIKSINDIKRDLSNEYIQSIVEHHIPIQSNYDQQHYQQQRGEKDDDDGDGDGDGEIEYENGDFNHSNIYNNKQRLGQRLSGELVIDEKHHLDSDEIDLMEKKKEKILLQSLRRQQASEESRRRKEMGILRRKEEEANKMDEKIRKREEEKARKQAILEMYRIKKNEELEKEGKGWEVQETTKRFLRPKSGPPNTTAGRQRPKTIHLSQVDSGANSYGDHTRRSGSGILRRSDSQTSNNGGIAGVGGSGRTSTSNLLYSGGGGGGGRSSGGGVESSDGHDHGSNRNNNVRDPWGSTSSLNQDNRRSRGLNMYNNRRSQSRPRELSSSRLDHGVGNGRRRQHSSSNYNLMGGGGGGGGGGSRMGSQDYLQHRGNSTSSLLDGIEMEIINSSRVMRGGGGNGGGGSYSGRSSHTQDSDSGLGTCTPPISTTQLQRRSSSPPLPTITATTTGTTITRLIRNNTPNKRLTHPHPQPHPQPHLQCSLPSPSSNIIITTTTPTSNNNIHTSPILSSHPHPHTYTQSSQPPPQSSSSSSLLSGKPWPGSLPPGLMSTRRHRFDDGASDISSVGSSNMDYSGLRLYKQPTAKSNRGIIMNAVEYCVFPGVVNRDSKSKVLDEIQQSESKHFLLMFRDAGCQFRALYTYVPETDEIIKLYGVGPKVIVEHMFEKFFKYNSGGKCFSQVHTKHLTVTIDAFTIHNALWQGKKGPISKTKDMALVI